MANILKHKNKDGVITSYTIRVYHGYDEAGKRLRPYTMNYKPAPNMTARQIEKELNEEKATYAELAEYYQVSLSSFKNFVRNNISPSLPGRKRTGKRKKKTD